MLELSINIAIAIVTGSLYSLIDRLVDLKYDFKRLKVDSKLVLPMLKLIYQMNIIIGIMIAVDLFMIIQFKL